jgi:hypothetical protein
MTYLVPKGHYFGDSSHDLNIECPIRHSQSVNFLISYPGVINIHLHRFSRRARSQNIGAKECILRDRSSAGRSCEISHPRRARLLLSSFGLMCWLVLHRVSALETQTPTQRGRMYSLPPSGGIITALCRREQLLGASYSGPKPSPSLSPDPLPALFVYLSWAMNAKRRRVICIECTPGRRVHI